MARIGSLIAAAVILLAPGLSGCIVGTVGGERMLPEVRSMLDFTAYPKARMVSENGSTESVYFADRPGRQGNRTYETTDRLETVRTYYERLASTKGWGYHSVNDDSPRAYSELGRLSKDRYQISIRLITPLDEPSPQPSAAWRFLVEAYLSN